MAIGSKKEVKTPDVDAVWGNENYLKAQKSLSR